MTPSHGSAEIRTLGAAAFLKEFASRNKEAVESYQRVSNERYATRAYTGGTSADAPAADEWVTELEDVFRTASGPLANIFRSGPLPDKGNSIEYANVEANTITTPVQGSEGDDLPVGWVTVAGLLAPVKTYGGATRLSLAAAQRSAPNSLAVTLEAMAAEAGTQKRTLLSAALASVVSTQTAIAANAGVVVLGATLGAATADNWTDVLVDAEMRLATKNSTAEALIVSATVAKRLLRLGLIRPGIGEVPLAAGGVSGYLAGLTPVYLDPDASGDLAAFVNGRAISHYTSSSVTLDDTKAKSLTAEYSTFWYGAIAPEVPALVLPVKLAAS